MEKANSRKQQAEKTKKLILSVANELSKEKDYDDISVQEICRLSNVSIGTFYHHFGSKDGLIIEQYKECDAYFQDTVLPTLIDQEPVYAITEYLAEQCRYAVKLGVNLIQIVYKAQINHGTTFFLSNERGLPNGLRQLLNNAKSQGYLREETDIEALLNELLIIGRGNIYNWCVYGGDYDLVRSVRTMTDHYIKAYIVKK